MVGVVAEVGANVMDFAPGDRCVADNSSSVSRYLHLFELLSHLDRTREADFIYYCCSENYWNILKNISRL